MPKKYTERPALENYTDVPLFNTKAVVQKIGIAAPTLRAWERRYTILSPERSQNDYRLYSERDIALLAWLKECVDAGMSISQAIALYRHLEEEHHQLHRDDLLPERASPARKRLPTDVVSTHATFADGNGQKKDETYSWPFVQEHLLEAFNRLDEAMASRWMTSMLAIYPIEQVCIELITPTLWEIGRLWEQGLLS
ncbi:MAG TPA: MerR family transcriptional regulator, partial [Ktedonobacteraceae bacterium]|nr:MerR family transcriptional regulator [Ktedonobacteraceae bacterium]